MSVKTRSGPSGSSSFLEFFDKQSLVNRAELALLEGEDHQAHWTYPLVVRSIKLLTYPMDHKLAALAIVALLMFVPVY